MAWAIRAGLHVCRVGKDFIFLDRLQDRYFLLGLGASADFEAFLAGADDPAVLSRLAAQGLLENGPDTAPTPSSQTMLEPAQASHVDDDDDTCAASLPRLAEAIWFHLNARHAIRAEGFDATLRDVAQRKAGMAGSASNHLYRPVVGAFQASARYMSATDQCLPRSIAMMRMLIRRGLPAQLVIGVSLPFVAHCWVQVGSTVLSDRLDDIRGYQPLLVL